MEEKIKPFVILDSLKIQIPSSRVIMHLVFATLLMTNKIDKTAVIYSATSPYHGISLLESHYKVRNGQTNLVLAGITAGFFVIYARGFQFIGYFPVKPERRKRIMIRISYGTQVNYMQTFITVNLHKKLIYCPSIITEKTFLTGMPIS